MPSVSSALNRVVGPFLAGASLAAAVSSDSLAAAAVMLGIAGISAFVSFPAGGRLVERLIGAED